ncbi:efflux RND transporter permease subunit [Robbsia sp. KACC 23696]|uniref:efflux RND transporter permease subunit n=1 Tax=Robbsia sp. KACC 23696 TaxID=3149231 RepID=UPI00325BCC3F
MKPSDRGNLSAWTLRHQSFVIFVLVLVSLFGVLSYSRLSQSEDPPFTFKTMVVRTLWPGASAEQVQSLVTDKIGRTLQQTPNVDFLRAYSRPGESTLFFTILDSAPSSAVPDTWYQVRKRVGDMAYTLPDGVQGPFFNDEFGDVYTNVYALRGDGFSPDELRAYADALRAQLLHVPGVAKVDYFGDQNPEIDIEIDNARLAQLGLAPSDIAAAIRAQNAVSAAGTIDTAQDRITIRPSGQFGPYAPPGAPSPAHQPYDPDATARAALANVLLRAPAASATRAAGSTSAGATFRLGDIATIRRGYADPPAQTMRFDGHTVLGLGITMAANGDVIALGHALDARVKTLQSTLPVGLSLQPVTNMPHAVSDSVSDFIHSVAEAVVIVLAVSLVSLGWRTGMVVVISIPLVLAATALGMSMFGIGLHKVSLGTLVLALGLLVDDAIIAVEMMAVKLAQGWERGKAAAFAYTSTAFPMLTGTLVTVAGFLPIALARSGTGEYTRSIFEVSALALLLSWLSAVIVVPLLGYHLLKPKATTHAGDAADAPVQDPHVDHTAHDDHEGVYDSRFYHRLRHVIEWCITRRWRVLAATGLVFVLSLAGFGLVSQQFFPSSNRPELLIDLRLPDNASYDATLVQVKRMEAIIRDRSDIAAHIDNSTAFVGTGAPRFFLSLDQQLAQPNFAQFLVTAKSVADREALATALRPILRDDFGFLRTRLTRLENGPPTGYPVQFRISGDDIATVRRIADQVAASVRTDTRTHGVQLDWDEPGRRTLTFDVDQAKARAAGITSQDIAQFLALTVDGYPVTQWREDDRLVPIVLRGPRQERRDPARLAQLSMPTPQGPVPLNALGAFVPAMDYSVIWTRDRQPVITVQADVSDGVAGLDVMAALDKQLAPLRAGLPIGYAIKAGGPIEENAKAQRSIVVQLPLLGIVVLVLLMMQLQSFSRTLLVVLTAPLGLIGVVAALLLFHQPFGFVAMLGVIAMFGIIMRNSVILVDQIERDIAAGHPRLDAIVDATVRRFRPIVLTAAAAVLALIPLLRNGFFSPMATALMGGITVATLLTILFVPALYAAWFRVKAAETRPPQGSQS